MLKPGQLFAGRYRIERLLAQGGMGVVFVAEQISTEARVAIKVLWAQTLASSDAIEKFKLEARIAGRVNSDHIVRVLDAGFDEETRLPFLVMELLVGQDLARLVETSGPLSPEKVVRYMAQVAAGLDRAHRYVDRSGEGRPIVHRDLKPENLFLVEREHGEPIIKILDFGIAKVASDSNLVSQEVRGTPLFMAYEQAAGEAVGPQTDVWSLGLIVYWLLTGKHYWKAGSGEAATLKRLFGELLVGDLVPASERARETGLHPSWPPGFDAWFARCVNRDAKQRFASAGDAVTGLARVFGVRVPSARPQSSERAMTTDISVAPTLPTPVGVSAGSDSEPAVSPSRPAISVTQRSGKKDGARIRWWAVAAATTFVVVAAVASMRRTDHQPSQQVSADLVSPTRSAAPAVAPAGPTIAEPTPTPAPSVGEAGDSGTAAPPPPSSSAKTTPRRTVPSKKKETVYDER